MDRHFDYFEFAGGHETLAKFAAFLVVQTLVYLILSNSGSGVFSGDSFRRRRPVPVVERSESARRMAALLADMAWFGGELAAGPSTPSSAGSQRGGRTPNDGGGEADGELELMLMRCSFSS
uniref:Uncharacterized protein n=1 Tax=Oryza brachyantha TaxID=4533 RepID=J3KZB6_ORYBR